MNGMHCFIDSTSILVKIKSVSLYNCQTVCSPTLSARSGPDPHGGYCYPSHTCCKPVIVLAA